MITHDDGAAVNPLTIPIAGFATDVDLILGVLELDFGDVRVGSQKQLFVGFETLVRIIHKNTVALVQMVVSP